MTKIGLCMIVKDEGGIIRRCLDSVKRLIDYVCIVDTGSTDNTVEQINNWLGDNKVEGKVHTKNWINFASNRTHALQTIRDIKSIDYVLMIDADEILEYENNFDVISFKNSLVNDLYDIRCKLGSVEYLRTTLTKNCMPYSYRGVLHEFLHCSEHIRSRSVAQGFYNKPIQDSNRNKHGSSKFLEDAKTLEAALAVEADPELVARYTFYLAQSYKDCGQYEKSIEKYLDRAKLGMWREEVCVSYYHAANLMSFLGYDEDKIIQTYLSGIESSPNKVECYYKLANFCNNTKRYQQAYMISSFGIKLKKENAHLFNESMIWDYGMEHEYCKAAYNTGNYKEGFDVARKLIRKVPESEKNKVIDTFELILDKVL